MKRAVFLDRDGILNRLVVREGRAVSPRSLAEFELMPGIEGAIASLKSLDLVVVVVTNQPDVARGLLTVTELEAMNSRLLETVPVDAVYVCAHDDRDGCPCRKPKPGLLLDAAREWQIQLEDSWMVGDSWKDMEAGREAGCRTCLVRTPATDARCTGTTLAVSSLPEAVHAIAASLQGAARSQATARTK